MNRAKLIHDAYDPNKIASLAVFKPGKISDFKIEKGSREWDKDKLDFIRARALQIDLFAGEKNPFEVVKKVPYTFYYEFLDDENQKSKLQIIDWKKYWDDFALTKDVHLILGTTLEFHNKKAPNPFVIIGVFAPKHQVQTFLKL
jgi:hypothetical protein